MAISVWTTHSLEKLFPETEPPPRAARSIRLKAACNESEDAQIAVRAAKRTTVERAGFECSDLVAESGARIAASNVECFWEWYTYVLRNPPHSTDPSSWLRNAPGFFPDAFIEEREVRVPAEWTQPLWVRVRVPEGTPAGTYAGTVTVKCALAGGGSEDVAVPLELAVWPFSLPRRFGFLHTEWFDPLVLARYYRIEPWSEAHWEWIGRVAADMAAHHQNMILTHFFELVRVTRHRPGGYEFDFSRLDRWVETFRARGVDWIEGGHLAGRSGGWKSGFVWRRFPIYDNSGAAVPAPGAGGPDEFEPAVEAFVKAVHAHVAERWGRDRLVQHIADEPVPENSASWAAMAAKLRAWVPGVRIIDATMCEELVGKVDVRVPQIQEIPPGRAPLAGELLWSYVCLAPQGHHPNRFLDIASIRNRIIFWLSFSLRLEGFLHWGYAHWAPWVPGTPACVDLSPWRDATGGSIHAHDTQPLPAGDPHIVHPGRGSICSSVRWEVVRKGLEDVELLKMLEERALADGGRSDAGARALALVDRIRGDLAHDSLVYTRDDAALLAAREEAGDLVAELGR